MTNNPNRDLLVLFNHEAMTPQAMEHEVELLHKLLYSIERVDVLACTHELLDLNKYRIVSKPHLLRKIFLKDHLKPFEFLNCKN